MFPSFPLHDGLIFSSANLFHLLMITHFLTLMVPRKFDLYLKHIMWRYMAKWQDENTEDKIQRNVKLREKNPTWEIWSRSLSAELSMSAPHHRGGLVGSECQMNHMSHQTHIFYKHALKACFSALAAIVAFLYWIWIFEGLKKVDTKSLWCVCTFVNN